MAGINARLLRGDAPTPVRVTAGQSSALNANQRALEEATRSARSDKHARRRTIRVNLGTTNIVVQHGLGRVPEVVQLKRVLNSGPAPSYTITSKTSRHLFISSGVATTVEFEVW